MSDEYVWGNVIQPLKSGAEYMTGYASKDAATRHRYQQVAEVFVWRLAVSARPGAEEEEEERLYPQGERIQNVLRGDRQNLPLG